MIENSISQALIDEDAFNSTKSTFQALLKKASYNYEIKFSRDNTNSKKKIQETQMHVFQSTIQPIC